MGCCPKLNDKFNTSGARIGPGALAVSDTLIGHLYGQPFCGMHNTVYCFNRSAPEGAGQAERRFKPFIMHRLVRDGQAPNIKSARRLVERGRPEVYDILEEVVKERPVLLQEVH